MIGVKFAPHAQVRLGLIGLGVRGGMMLRNWLACSGVEVTAVCDLVEAKVRHAVKAVQEAGQKTPAVYWHGEHDFENLCRRDDVDFVYIATPWQWHAPMALSALMEGKHCGMEVPGATTLEDCHRLVVASERSRRHCLLMENTCYRDVSLLLRNMVHGGVFGELVHGEGAYLHDMRQEMFTEWGTWRREWYTEENGNIYPTHGLGPIARCMDMHRGDRLDHLVSMSSPALGMDAYRAEHGKPGMPGWNDRFLCADVNTSILKTVRGRTILLGFGTTTPRPYDSPNSIVGTKGIFRDFPARLYLDGRNPEAWTTIEPFKPQFEDPLWKKLGTQARRLGGEGGMDFIMCSRLMQCMQEGLAPDMDVYDAAAWSAVAPLSVASVANGSAPVRFPDFTGGNWAQPRS